MHSLEKKITLTTQKMYHIHINSKRNKAGLCCFIFFLRGQDEEVLNSLCLLQYTIAKEAQSTEVVHHVSPNGNRKGKRKPYSPAKKSTIQAIRDKLGSNSAAVAFRISRFLQVAPWVLHILENCPDPENRCTTSRTRLKKVDDVDELLLYARHREEPTVLEHHDVPEDLQVLAKPNITKDLSRFCTSDKLSHQLSVDPTFNFGKCEVTAFTYKHLFLKSKRTGEAPSFLGPIAIHYSQQKNVYNRIVLAVANSSRDLADKAKGFIKDGEESLYSALGEVMSHATGLRCFRHFHQNCRDKLHKQTEQNLFIDTVFGRPTSKGLLSAHNKSDLKAHTRWGKVKWERISWVLDLCPYP